MNQSDESSRSHGNGSSSNDAPRRVSRHVQPLGPRVLVRVLKDANRLQSGLYLPEGAKDLHAEAFLGEVVEVARTLPKTAESRPRVRSDDDDDDFDDGEMGANVSGIPMGANVLFPKDKGVRLPWDESLRLLDVRHILALVEVIDEEHMQ
jgi:hypothetical protein